MHEVVKLLGSDTVIRDVTLSLDLEAAPATVSGDRIQLQQVLLNLLLNAMEAMSECDRSDRRLTVRTRSQRGASVVVWIEDSGPGLAAPDEEAIFEPFYTTKPAGMGMGLTIARSIIASHGGTIVARNNAVKGAVFQFWLPLSRHT